jgi:hypothetical protein
MMSFCDEHEYEYAGDECPACADTIYDTAEGQYRAVDTTLVIHGDTDVVIDDVSLTRGTGEHEGMATTLDDADMTFSGSFSVAFEDEDDAREFWEWLHRGAVSLK